MSSGHSVIVVPVPELDDVVRAGAARYDPSFVSTDPGFMHAHVTLLGPWLDAPSADDRRTVSDALAAEPPFAFELTELDEFPDGTLHLVAEPAAPFSRLTARLSRLFPQTPPYAGRFAELVPHLTLDHRATGASISSLDAELADRLPIRSEAGRVDLQWWANDDCHVMHTWRLGR